MKPWGKGAFVLAIVLGLLVTPAVHAQETKDQKQEKQEKKENKKKKLKFDFSFKYDPLELHKYSRQSPRRLTLKGPVGIGGFHVPTAYETGPALGPPLQIWGTGWGASLWRDPITGRYIQ